MLTNEIPVGGSGGIPPAPEEIFCDFNNDNTSQTSLKNDSL